MKLQAGFLEGGAAGFHRELIGVAGTGNREQGVCTLFWHCCLLWQLISGHVVSQRGSGGERGKGQGVTDKKGSWHRNVVQFNGICDGVL